MIIEERKITVGEVCEGYFNDAEEGVVGYNERLDIRPKYQREFVYKDAQRDEVIRTVLKAPNKDSGNDLTARGEAAAFPSVSRRNKIRCTAAISDE